jgi:hypothetical protein
LARRLVNAFVVAYRDNIETSTLEESQVVREEEEARKRMKAKQWVRTDAQMRVSEAAMLRTRKDGVGPRAASDEEMRPYDLGEASYIMGLARPDACM